MYSQSRQKQNGSILPLVVVALTALLLIASLAISGTTNIRLQAAMQTAADAGAIAGAIEASKKNDNSRWRAQAVAAIQNNGFIDACTAGDVCVTVNFPSQGVCNKRNTSDSQQVEVIITKPQPYIFNQLQTTVRACSVASLAGYTTCLLALEPRNAGVSTNGNIKIDVKNCGFTINSSNSQALQCTGGATGAYIKSMFFNIVGGLNCNIALSPNPTTGQNPVVDPLRSEPPPAFPASCTSTTPAIANNATLSPGVYCGGITIGNNNKATFMPGDYILLGGGLNVGSGSTISGTGLRFYNTCVNSFTTNPRCTSTALTQTPSGCKTSSSGSGVDCSTPKAFNITGNANVNISSAKTMKFILFWGDRSITGLINNISGTSTVANNPTYDMSLFYFPSQNISLQGNATFINGGVIANDISLGGSALLTVNLPASMESIFGQNSRPKTIQ